MGMIKGIGILAGITAVGIVIFAQKRSAETGRDIKDVMSNLPEELKCAGGEMKQKLKGAAGDYKKAAAKKEAEIDELLEEEESKLNAAKDSPAEAAVSV